MAQQHFSTTLLVDQSPAEVFAAIIDPRAWWSEEIQGHTGKTGDVFNYHFEDIHRCTMRLMEVVPDTKVVWLVLDNYFKPGLFEGYDETEWLDTRVVFEIESENDKTRLRFTHEGLVPAYACYDICVNGWTHYIRESLYRLITTGEGQPNKTGRPMTADEEDLTATSSRMGSGQTR